MKRFEYLSPNSLDEALAMLAERPEAAILAGGTNVLVQIKEGHREETVLLSVRKVPQLHDVRNGAGLHIGAGVTFHQLAVHPTVRRDYNALATAAGLIGSVQTRNMATIGGNICNASPSADSAPPLLVSGAQVLLASERGTRQVLLADFFTAPGETVLWPGELLQEIILPPVRPRAGSAYVRHIPRQAMDISVAGVAAALELDEAGQIAAASIALGAVAATPMMATAAADLLIGRSPGDDLWREAGRTAALEADPMDDIRASIPFRRHLVDILTQDALRAALNNSLKQQKE